MDRHSVDCTAEGVLKSWQMRRPACSAWEDRIEYECVKAETTECTQHQSACQRFSRQVRNMRDFPLACPVGKFVSKWRIHNEGCGNDWGRMHFTCCTVVPHCPVTSVKGMWKLLFYTNGSNSVTYFEGVRYTDGREVLMSWTESLRKSLKSGFTVKIVVVDVSVETTTTVELSTAVTERFMESTTIDRNKANTFTFGTGGQIWQWVAEVEDACGPSDIFTRVLVATPSSFEPPCCLPGAALVHDREHQHGACRPGTPCLCQDEELCFPTSSPTMTPTSAPSPAPTQAPTPSPTQAPTLLPTEAPTMTVTKAPTLLPTEPPTPSSTQAPTLLPTKAPTNNTSETETSIVDSSSTSSNHRVSVGLAIVALVVSIFGW